MWSNALCWVETISISYENYESYIYLFKSHDFANVDWRCQPICQSTCQLFCQLLVIAATSHVTPIHYSSRISNRFFFLDEPQCIILDLDQRTEYTYRRRTDVKNFTWWLRRPINASIPILAKSYRKENEDWRSLFEEKLYLFEWIFMFSCFCIFLICFSKSTRSFEARIGDIRAKKGRRCVMYRRNMWCKGHESCARDESCSGRWHCQQTGGRASRLVAVPTNWWPRQ